MSTNAEGALLSAGSFALLQATVQRLQPDWQQAVEDFQYLAGGYTNANYQFSYLGEGFVLRTPLSTTDPAANHRGLAAEILFRSSLQQRTALCIAPLVAADVTRGEMITRFIDGPLLAEQLPTADQAIVYLRHLHEQLIRIPQVAIYNLEELVSNWLPKPPAWLRAYLDDGSDLKLLAQGSIHCCHNDLNPWNIIRSSEQPQAWTTLDWETAKLAHPVFDAVTLHQGLAAERALGDEAVARDGTELHAATPDWPALREFCAQALSTPVNATVLNAALRCYWLREYAWADAQICQGNQNPAIAAQHRQAEQQLRMLL